MEKPKKSKKATGKPLKREKAKVVRKPYSEEPQSRSFSKEPAVRYGEPALKSFPPGAQKSFKVTIGGVEKNYFIDSGYGYFIPSFRKAENLMQVSESVERGIPSKEIESITQYLGFKIPEIAKAAAVSTSTVSRWEPETSIGQPGSSQFFRIDEVIRKGVNLFGGEQEFKNWLNSPNLALGNAVPAKLVTSLIGVDLVDEALDALHYGNVI